MSAFFEGVQAGRGIVDEGVSAYDRARQWTDRLLDKQELRDATAAKIGREAEQTKYDRTRDTVKDSQQSKEFDEKVRHDKATEQWERERGTRGRVSPTLAALQKQHQQLSSDIRTATMSGLHPAPDVVKRYNSIGAALNSQIKREDPLAIVPDFVPMPEPAAPKADTGGIHPIEWIGNMVNSLSPKPTAAPGQAVEDWRQFDK